MRTPIRFHALAGGVAATALLLAATAWAATPGTSGADEDPAALAMIFLGMFSDAGDVVQALAPLCSITSVSTPS